MNTEYTKDQWTFEMAEARANGCMTMTFEEWLDYRARVDALFDELTGE